MEKIVLVGNGRSVLAREGLGDVIDRFDRVVRFNNFQAQGFERFVGSRTDWWARNETPEVKPRIERFQRILLRPRMEEPDLYQRSADEVAAQLRESHGDTPVELVDREVYLHLCDRYGFRNAPLTGTLVIAHLLQRYRRVYVCGFDGLGGGPEALRHYFSERSAVGDWAEYHHPEPESRYLSEQIDAGRVVVL